MKVQISASSSSSLKSSEMIPASPTAERPDYRDVAIPLRIAGDRPRAAERPPGRGEHTREILASLGYDEAGIEALLSSGAAG